MAEEGLRKTDNDLIYIGNPIPFDVDEFLKQLRGLMDSAYNNRRDIRERVKEVVKTYHPEDGGGRDQSVRSSRCAAQRLLLSAVSCGLTEKSAGVRSQPYWS